MEYLCLLVLKLSKNNSYFSWKVSRVSLLFLVWGVRVCVCVCEGVQLPTHTCAHMQTQTHRDTQTQSCCLHRTYPFDPLTGTRRISKWEEKPQSRSTSQRRALSIGSCPTPQGSRGRRCLSQEAITLLSGSEVCLECYLHLSGWEAGGQEVRQEWDHLYHVLCMTCGMCLNIYMCLKVMQIERKKEEVQRTVFPLSTKTVRKQLSMMQFQSWTCNTLSAYHLLIRVPDACNNFQNQWYSIYAQCNNLLKTAQTWSADFQKYFFTFCLYFLI